jgi:hypothetical protein
MSVKSTIVASSAALLLVSTVAAAQPPAPPPPPSQLGSAPTATSPAVPPTPPQPGVPTVVSSPSAPSQPGTTPQPSSPGLIAPPSAPMMTTPGATTVAPGTTGAAGVQPVGSAPAVAPLTPQTSVLPAPAALPTDPDIDTAVVLLERIQTLTGGALKPTAGTKLDSASADQKSGSSGQVKVDRATLDEIQALAGEIASMLPMKKQP